MIVDTAAVLVTDLLGAAPIAFGANSGLRVLPYQALPDRHFHDSFHDI